MKLMVSSRDTLQKVEELNSPTVGLENDFFTVGAAKDASKFAEIQKKIARYVAVTFRAAGSMAQLAIERETLSMKAAESILAENATHIEEKSWELAFEKHHKDLNTWDEVSKKAYQLPYCTVTQTLKTSLM